MSLKGLRKFIKYFSCYSYSLGLDLNYRPHEHKEVVSGKNSNTTSVWHSNKNNYVSNIITIVNQDFHVQSHDLIQKSARIRRLRLWTLIWYLAFSQHTLYNNKIPHFFCSSVNRKLLIFTNYIQHYKKRAQTFLSFNQLEWKIHSSIFFVVVKASNYLQKTTVQLVHKLHLIEHYTSSLLSKSKSCHYHYDQRHHHYHRLQLVRPALTL
jgi:hypothetical protein